MRPLYKGIKTLTDEQQEEVVLAFSDSLVNMMLSCGVASNVAWLVVLDCNDQIRKLDLRRSINGGGTLGGQFKRVIRLHEDMDHRLLSDDKYNYFDAMALSEDMQKRHGKLTDKEFFELWQASGNRAYNETRPYVLAYQHKLALIFEKNGMSHPEEKAWGLVGETALAIASTNYQRQLEAAINHIPYIPNDDIRKALACFNPEPLRKLWVSAIDALDPAIRALRYTELEKENIAISIRQLAQEWTSEKSSFNALRDTTANYGEFFRTPGEQKKFMREIDEWEEETNELREKNKATKK